MKLEFHEYANLFPLITGNEFETFKADIKANGVREKIWLYEGKILDGRNRYLAAIETDALFETEEYLQDDPLAFVISLNLKRRHLSSDQRAAIAVETLPLYEKEAKERQESGNNQHSSLPEKSPGASRGDARDKAAKQFNTNGRYVSELKKIKEDDPETFQQIKSGDKKLVDVNKDKKASDLEDKKAENQKVNSKDIADNRPKLFKKHYRELFNLLDNNSMDLLITDPPYSTDIDDIESFVDDWLFNALDKVKQDGRAYICIGAYPEELQAYLNKLSEQTRFIVDNPLIWTYRNTLGVTPKNKYNLNYQVILHLYTTESEPLDTSITNEMFSVQDINAPDGRLGDRFHTWQKPEELGLRLIRHSTKENDSIFDPFACTGTFPIAAAKLNRSAIGCDISEDNLRIAASRGCDVVY
jgi:hypothetical protein